MPAQIRLLSESTEGMASEASSVAIGHREMVAGSLPSASGRGGHLSMEGASGRTRRAV
jgi:hypothetical protein